MTNDLPPLLDSPPRDQHGRIDHGGCSHPATPAGRKVCREHVAWVAGIRDKAIDRMLAEFSPDRDSFWAPYLIKACFKFCGDAHDTRGHDEVTGQPWKIVHHTTRRDCAAALVDAGAKIDQIRWSFS